MRRVVCSELRSVILPTVLGACGTLFKSPGIARSLSLCYPRTVVLVVGVPGGFELAGRGLGRENITPLP